MSNVNVLDEIEAIIASAINKNNIQHEFDEMVTNSSVLARDYEHLMVNSVREYNER